MNRNYEVPSGASESRGNQCEEGYGGPSSFSEAETQTMKNLLMQEKNINLWIHLDGLGNKFFVPYSYSSDSYASTLSAPDTEFYKTLLSLNSKTVQTGTYSDLDVAPAVGTLIDYAYSQGVISLECAIGSEIEKKEDILDIVEDHYEYIEDILKYSSFKLSVLELESMNESVCATSECNDVNAYSESILKFKILNEGLGNTSQGNLQLSLSYDNEGYSFLIRNTAMLYSWPIHETSDSIGQPIVFTCTTVDKRRITCGVPILSLDARSRNVIEVTLQSFKTPEYLDQEISFKYTASYTITYLSGSALGLSSAISEDTLILNSTLRSSDLDSDSQDEDQEDSTDNLSLWDLTIMPHNSGNHKEGVAVGLVSGFMSLIFLLIGGFIYYKYRKENLQNESSDEEEVDNPMKNTFIPQAELQIPPIYSGADISAKLIENARKDIPALNLSLNLPAQESVVNRTPERLNISPIRDSPLSMNFNSESMEEIEIDEIEIEQGS